MNLLKKYKHGLVMLVFGIFYLLAFSYLEQKNTYGYHLIHIPLDDMIPFSEYFIVPYLLWFPYMFLTILYFVFINKDTAEYYQLAKNLCLGMSLFLVISFLYPNGHHLRPNTFSRDNIFVKLVQFLYATDTPTNILPSIHVFNSLAACMAVNSCQALKQKKAVRISATALTLLIVASTMFLKQHSVVDVIMGSALAGVGYLIFYNSKARERAGAKHSVVYTNGR